MPAFTRRTIAAIATGLSIGALMAALLLFSRDRPSVSIESAPIIVVDWKALVERSRTALAGKKYDELRAIEDTLRTPPDEVSLRDFARVALTCALGRSASGNADPYPMLAAAYDAVIRTRGADQDDASLDVELAIQFLHINLLRKAKALLDASAPESRSHRVAAVQTVLAEVIPATASRTAGAGDLANPCLTSPTLGRELVRLLEDSAETEPIDTAPLSSRARDCRELPVPTERILPLAAPRDDLQDSDDPAADGDTDEPHNRTLARAAIDRLSQMMGDSDQEVFDISDTRLTVIYDFAGEKPEEPTFTDKVNISQTSGGFIVSWAFDAFWIAKTTGQSLVIDSYNPFVSEMDLNGDGALEAVITSVEGSGQFLTAAVIDQRDTKYLWRILDPIDHGHLAMVNLDSDRALELVTLETADYLFQDCTQCLARATFNVYDFEEGAAAYRRVSRGTTLGEMGRGGVADNPWGVSPQMRLALGSADAEAAMARLMRGAVDWSTNDALPDFQTVFDRYQDLMAAARHTEAASLMNRAANALRMHSLPDIWRHRLTFALLAEVSALASAGEYQSASTRLDTLDRRIVVDQEPLLTEYSRLRTKLQLNFSQFGDALKTIRSVPESIQPALNGELAAYYRTVGRLDLAYVASVGAVGGGGPYDRATPMAVAGLAAFDLGREIDAIDWMTRAIVAARVSGPGIATEVFLSAASIAYRSKMAAEALVLLNEGVVGLQPESWTRMSPRVFELWAAVLQGSGDFRVAEVMWRRAADTARAGEPAAATAEAGLSRLLWMQGHRDEAREHARRAFEATTSTRVAITEEFDKLAFVTDRKTIAEWYLEVLAESNASPTDVLSAVEAWRLRTMLDQLEAGTGPETRRSEDVAATLTSTLRRDEAFVSFVFTANRGLAIVVRGDDDSSSVIPLSLAADSVRALVARIGAEFSLSERAVLSAIRSNQVPHALTNALAEAGRHLVEPLGLGSFKAVLVSADEALFGLPWPAVVAHNKPLVETQSWIAVPSLAVSFSDASATPRRGRGRLLVSVGTAVDASETTALGDPALGAVNLPPLRGALAEVLAVATAFRQQDVTFLVDPETIATGRGPKDAMVAEPNRFLELAGSSEVIHVAAHGLFAPSNPMDSAIFLARTETGRTLLRARDLSAKDLRGVRIVVLAACQSGTTQALVSAEPLGFLRGLLRSGVRDVILAQWQIDDVSSPELFEDFYTNLNDSGSTEQSLRAAQLSMRARRSHPFFWAGLTLYRGRWQAAN